MMAYTVHEYKSPNPAGENKAIYEGPYGSAVLTVDPNLCAAHEIDGWQRRADFALYRSAQSGVYRISFDPRKVV